MRHHLSILLMFVCAVALSGCQSTMRQTYIGEAGKRLEIEVIDSAFSRNISNTEATYKLAVNPITGAQELSISIGAARDVDHTGQIEMGKVVTNALMSGFAGYLASGGNPIVGGAASAVGAGTALLNPPVAPHP